MEHHLLNIVNIKCKGILPSSLIKEGSLHIATCEVSILDAAYELSPSIIPNTIPLGIYGSA